MKQYLILTLGLVFAATSSLEATVIFSDNFNSYADGTADSAYTAAYNNNPGTGDQVATGVGLGGSKGIQNDVSNFSLNSTLTRKNVSIALSNGPVTIDIFFQEDTTSPFGSARPQIGLLDRTDNGGVFNNVNTPELSCRIGGANTFELRANSLGVLDGGIDMNTLLTSGNWYDMRLTITRTTTNNTFAVTAWIFNSDTNGVVGSLVTSVTTNAVINSQFYTNQVLYAAVRENSQILNMDNFSVSQVPFSAPPPATVLFSDGFDSYTNGTTDTAYTAAYGGISGGPTCVVTNGTGLSGSKSVQAPGTTDMTLIRKNVAIDLTAGTVTNSVFFQRVSAQIAAPQIGLMSELSGALNTVNSVGGRLNQFDQLDVRSSEGGTQSSVGTAVSVGTLTNGNWYNIRTIITKTATTNQLTIVLQLWNSDTNGVAGTLIAANTQTATNASVWADTTLYAAIRLNNGNSGVSNLDNFSATQVLLSSVSVPLFTSISSSGGNVTMKGSGGAAAATYYLSSSTNLTTARSAWTHVQTNTFAADGKFTNTVPLNPASKQTFFGVEVP